MSFVDYAPTVLNLLGLPTPEAMQGEPFLGKDAAAPRRYVYGHRDRVDEVRDLARSVRDSRTFTSVTTCRTSATTNLPFGRIAARFATSFIASLIPKMTPAQWHFAGPTRPLRNCTIAKSTRRISRILPTPRLTRKS